MLLSDRLENAGPAQFAKLPMLSRMVLTLAFAIARWQMLSVTRKSLRKLDTHLLLDIGLEPGEAESECTKRFWER